MNKRRIDPRELIITAGTNTNTDPNLMYAIGISTESFIEVFKNLSKYRYENIFVELSK